MNTSEIAAKRQQLESLYAEQVRALEKQRAELDAWRSERLAALSLISDDSLWLKLPGIKQNIYPRAQEDAPRNQEPPVHRKPIVQADEIRVAINALRTGISIVSVRDWLHEHKPDIADSIQSRSIRTLLWRMDTEGKLKFVRTDGNAKVYELIDRNPIPSGDDK